MAGLCEVERIRRSPGDETLALTRCHSCGLPQLQYMKPLKNVSPFVAEPTNKRAQRGKFPVFLFFIKVCFSFTVSHFIA